MINIILLLLFGLSGLAAFLVGRQRLPIKKNRFSDRKPMSSHEIYNEFFKTSGLNEDEVVSLWEKVGSVLNLDSSLLRPGDKFRVELAAVPGYSAAQDELGELEDYFDRRCQELGINPKSQQIETLGDFIRVLCSPNVVTKMRQPTQA